MLFVTCWRRVFVFYDWYIEQRYSIDTLLILGICQCGATILGDLPTFSNWGGRNTGISIYQFIFGTTKIIPIFVTKLEGVECRACSLHAAAKKYYLLHRTGSTTGAPAFCVALRQSRPIASVENSRRWQSYREVAGGLRDNRLNGLISCRPRTWVNNVE